MAKLKWFVVRDMVETEPPGFGVTRLKSSAAN